MSAMAEICMDEVPVETFASPQLAAELWISLASLLRSHVAMHSIAQPNGKLRISSRSGKGLELLGPIGKLTILPPDAAGAGSTEFRPEAGELGDEYATFFFTEDGLVRLADTDVPLEFEAAVEHWLGKVRA
jgi:hypothetical protein